MRSTQIIESSLQRKIKENEKKMQNLLSTKSNKTSSLYYIPNYTNTSAKSKNKVHKKNKSQEEMKTNSNKKKKLKYQFSTIQNEENSDDSMNLVNKIEKRLKSFSKSPNIKAKIISHKVVNDKNVENCNTKKVNKEELDKIVNRLYTNEKQSKKKKENERNIEIDFGSKTEKCDSKRTKVNFNEIYSRFQEDIKKRNENLEKKREEIQNNNKNIYTYKPKLNINKKFFDSEHKTNFIERQKKFMEDKKQKEEKYKEELIKKKQQEIDNTNILVKHPIKSKKEIIRGINGLTEWENNRKKKLEEKQKEIEDERMSKFKYKPIINKNSITLAQKNIQRQKESNVFMRLAQDDKVLIEKKKILIQLNTPSFKPTLYKTKRKILIRDSSKEKEFDDFSKKYKSEDNVDNSDSDIDEEKYDESSHSNDKEENEECNDSNIYTEKNIQNAYRKAIFHKTKK